MVEDLPSLRDATRAAIAIPTTTPAQIIPSQAKPEGEPDWVNKENRRFYLKLVGNADLLVKVAEVISQYPKDNSALAAALLEVEWSKGDATAFDSAFISRIKKVVEHLNAPQAP